MMHTSSRYGVYPTENDISDPTAIFDDEGHAEEYAAKLSCDPDFDGCDYVVVQINLDGRTISEQPAAAESDALATAIRERDNWERQAQSMATANTILRKIAAHVPARIWIKAKEVAGYGTEIRVQIADPSGDEAWLQFVAAGRASTADRPSRR
jgi:hypothetical protein